ncbi:MAG: carboxy-S-adenosyl-L-methionine synthase CmoA [Flavobacteriales bacterium]
MSKDQVFKKEKETGVDDFRFGEEVVTVFDDMVSRSVPFYGEIQRMIGDLSQDFAQPGTNYYDLGCSTGNSLLAMDHLLDDEVNFVGIDESPEMLEKCEKKFKDAGLKRKYSLEYGDLNSGVMIKNASVVNLCLTLQFVRPLYRTQLVQSIYDQMNEGGALILVEKVLGEDSMFNRMFIKHYYEMKKRHNYSEIEISQKREALENVLIPYKLEENKDMLKECGFKYIEVFFKWYNFCAIIAVK